jgi:predicted transcriptional regulator
LNDPEILGGHVMKKEHLRKMLFVLGKEHCLDVMISLHNNSWQTASEVARDLRIHIATAVKYLSELHDLGFLNRRIKRGKTREAFEYQLKDSKVLIEFDLTSLKGKKIRAEEKPLVLFSILRTLLLKSRKVVGQSVDDSINGRFEKLENGEKHMVMNSLMFDGELEDAKNYFQKKLNGLVPSDERCEDVVNALTELINSVIEHYESKVGQHSAESLVDVTMMKVISVLGGEIVEDNSVLSTLPDHYFEKWCG